MHQSQGMKNERLTHFPPFCHGELGYPACYLYPTFTPAISVLRFANHGPGGGVQWKNYSSTLSQTVGQVSTTLCAVYVCNWRLPEKGLWGTARANTFDKPPGVFSGYGIPLFSWVLRAPNRLTGHAYSFSSFKVSPRLLTHWETSPLIILLIFTFKMV